MIIATLVNEKLKFVLTHSHCLIKEIIVPASENNNKLTKFEYDLEF